MRTTSGSKLSGLVVTQISRNVLSSSAMLYLKMEWAAFSCSRKRMKVLRAGPAGATPRWMRSRVYMLLSVMTAATRRGLPGGGGSHGILFIMGISALEEIQVIVFHVFFEDAGFYVFAGIEINYFCHGASCAGFHISFIILWVHIKMKKYIISLIREQILSVPWYNNRSDYGTAIFIFYVINEMYGYN